MNPALTLALAGLGAAAGSYLLTAVAIRVARRTGFVDHPKGYKGHLAATPYLGGAAVLGAALAATLLLTGADRALSAVLGPGLRWP